MLTVRRAARSLQTSASASSFSASQTQYSITVQLKQQITGNKGGKWNNVQRMFSKAYHTTQSASSSSTSSHTAAASPPSASSSSSSPLTSPTKTAVRSTVRRVTFNNIMKRFNLLVHPDLFGNAPHHATVNSDSLQALNNLISHMRTKDNLDPYPPMQTLKLVFHIKRRAGDETWSTFVKNNPYHTLTAGGDVKKTQGKKQPNRRGGAAPALVLPTRGHGANIDGEFHTIPVVVTTNGSQCKKMVQEQFASMFYRCGLPFKFEWDDEYWNMGGGRSRAKQPEEEENWDEEAEEEERRR